MLASNSEYLSLLIDSSSFIGQVLSSYRDTLFLRIFGQNPCFLVFEKEGFRVSSGGERFQH